MFDSKEIARRALLRAEEQKAQKKRSRERLNSVVLVLSSCLVTFMAVFTFMSYNAGSNPPGELNINEGQVPLAGLPFDVAGVKDTENEPGFMLPGYHKIVIPADTAEVALLLPNPAGNACWFSFEIDLANTGEIMYASTLLPPSASIERVTLTRELSHGEYRAVLLVKTYGYGDLNEISEISQPIDLLVD